MTVDSRRGSALIESLKRSPYTLHLVPGDPYGSNVINAMNIIFPPGERGFIRILSQARPLVTDIELQRRIDDFVHQESQHARAHSIVVRQPQHCGKYATWAKRLTEFFVRFMFGRKNTRSHPLLIFRIGTVAAIEHLTAELGRWVFEDARFADLGCDVRATELLKWHAAEEMIHRAVAFDTLAALSPRWHRGVRSSAMLFWMPVFFCVWMLSAQSLMLDDKTVSKRILTPFRVHRSARSGVIPGIPRLVKRMGSFFRKSFHPDSIVSQETNAACEAYLNIPYVTLKQT